MSNQSSEILNITLKKAVASAAHQLSPSTPQYALHREFYGSPDSPFLAPRGIYVYDDILIVADTGQNRVFIWKELPLNNPFATPDLVLGQINDTDTGRNAGSYVSAGTLQYPSGLWTNGEQLIVCDAWNHRVLIWHQFPQRNEQAADVVLGQDDFTGNLPNKGGITTEPSASSLYWPYGVTVNDGKLWIADTGNRRVLMFDQVPTENGQQASAVIGQESFCSREYQSNTPVWPYSVKIGPNEELAITDTQYYRVLLWTHWESAFAHPPDTIIGQPDLESNGMNQYQLTPQPNALSWCYDSLFTDEGLLVADTGNSRILIYNQLPAISNTPADSLLGKADFYTGSENASTVFGTEKLMYWPFSLARTPAILAVADTGNHRILFYKSSAH